MLERIRERFQLQRHASSGREAREARGRRVTVLADERSTVGAIAAIQNQRARFGFA